MKIPIIKVTILLLIEGPIHPLLLQNDTKKWILFAKTLDVIRSNRN